jgi:hypothetical protein
MARNASGTYSLPTPQNPVVDDTPITIDWANTTLTDIATELTNSIDKGGRTTATANLPMGGFKHTGLAAGTTNGDSVRYEQLVAKADLAGATFTGAINEAKGADIASAATINLTAATGNLVHITGTTTITAITIPSGAERTLVFDGALTLTHHATTLILPSGANITTAAGDSCIVRGDGSGNARVISYTKASGQSVVTVPSALILLSTVTASNSATVDIETTFNSTYDAYMIVASGLTVDTDGANLGMRLKISGAYSATGYISHQMHPESGAATYVGTGNAAAHIAISEGMGNAAGECGNFTIHIHNPTSTTLQKPVHWTGGSIRSTGTIRVAFGAGSNTDTGAVTGVRFLMSAGNIVSGTFRLYGIANS